MRAVELLTENALAWELFHQARLPNVGALIIELRQIALTEGQAETLAHKLEVIGATYERIKADEIDRAKKEAETRRRVAQSKGR